MKKGFTLAEVLITLAIIGVVAALTIPTVVRKIQDQQLKVQFKKSYSTIQRVFSSTLIEYGATPACYNGPSGRAGANSDECSVFLGSFIQKLKIIKYCPNNAFTKGCLPNYAKYYADDSAHQSCTGFTESRIKTSNSAWILADGSIILGYYGQSYPIFSYDINGMKAPNKWGYDVFPFYILKKDDGKGVVLGVKPIGDGAYEGCKEMVSDGGKTTEEMLKWVYE